MAGLVEQLDGALAQLLTGWNIYSSALLLALIGFAGYIIYDIQDPDTHPLLLARQAQASYVRQPGESAVYRSAETPHGYPLRTGLGVKPPGTPMYSAGKDGDLRDIWRRAIGELPLEKGAAPSTGAKIMTVFGKEELTTHNLADITKDIVVVGKHLKEHGAKRVAIYLPNSVELLAALFAGAFYGFVPVLVPFNQPHASLIELLQRTQADALIAGAGSVPLAEVTKGASGLRQVVWTVEKTSRHMDWNEVPEGIGGKVDVSVWHELVQDQKSATPALPDTSDHAPNVVFLWQEVACKPVEIVDFTQQNLVSAVAAQLTALPGPQRLRPTDTFLAADAFTSSYPLALTLCALYTHCTVIINSVAGPGVDLTLASRAVAPTIVVISAETAAKLHSSTTSSIVGGPKQLAHYMESRSLIGGRLPTSTLFSTLIAPSRASIGSTPGKLRLLFISDRAGLNSPPLSPTELSDLRIYANARVIYALTSAQVAGAVAQTNVYDYRIDEASPNKRSHFGVPLSSLEIKLVDSASHKTTDEQPAGEIAASGPAVAGGSARLGINGLFKEDNTLVCV